MTTNQIRFTVTDSMVQALDELRHKFPFLSDAEMVKLALSEFYYREIEMGENNFSSEFEKEPANRSENQGCE